jgi:molybdopterin-binding protein
VTGLAVFLQDWQDVLIEGDGSGCGRIGGHTQAACEQPGNGESQYVHCFPPYVDLREKIKIILLRSRKGMEASQAAKPDRVCCYNSSMALSARNQLPGTIEDIQIGDIMAHVVVKVGNNLVESVITRTSAEELRLKKGDAVKIVVKSTEVMIQKE